MKPSNFPERKNQRRKEALARLKTHNGMPDSFIERAILNGRISPSLRYVRTKKRRESQETS